ncbi:MAG: cell division protein ZapA [Proteobacteria bacterium]|nr:cell division protein ZapA [Pseudomonadota bacterium]MDA1058970.1 cell division protein ZapA [Pseudomonadota bacterium]
MAVVDVVVNGRTYQVACDDGQEDHLVDLARYIDKRVAELAKTMGQVGDARLILMASLLVADELSEALESVDSMKQTLEDGQEERAGDAEATFATLASRIENIAARLESG